MKKFLAISLIFIPFLAHAVPPIVSPSTPIVNQGGTVQFTANGSGTWACSGTTSTGGVTACSGSINSGTGLYTAPSNVVAQHTYGGMQLLPNNDVYNTRIDSLPVNSNNGTWLTAANIGGSPGWHTDFPINYLTPTGPTESLNFLYTPANNGTFEIPSFPTAKAEDGWFSALQNRPPDHHIIMVDTVTATYSELYQYFPSCVTTGASVTGNVATLICTENPVTNEFIVGSSVVVGGFTGSDTFFNGNPFVITAVNSTSISYALTHANATATTNGSAGKDLNDSTGFVNSASGIKYTNATYQLPPISTDAAGMQLQPLILGLQEMEQAVNSSGTINHAFRNTFGLGVEASSNVWPATTFASDGGTIPFGVRARLKSNFNISSYSQPGQILLKALQQYGTFNADGGNEWPMNAEKTRWPKTLFDALTEVNTAGKTFTVTHTVLTSNVATITAANDYVANQSLANVSGTTNGSGAFNVSGVVVTSATSTQFQFALVHANIGSASDSGTAFSGLPNYMEFVDESSIMISTASGLTTENREIVKFTRTSDSSTSTVDVVLQGPAVNLPNDAIYAMAGTPAQQLTALNNFGGVTWSMSPAVGSITSGGLYTPSSSTVTAATATITATSVINSSISAQMAITVFPGSGIYAIPSQTVNYTDSFGNTWNARTGVDNLPDNQGCCACDNSAHFPAITDISLFQCVYGVSSDYPGDTHMDFYVPNGTYKVTYNYGTQNPVAGQFFKLTIGSNEIYSNLDPDTLAGGQFQPFTSVNTTVTNNQLSVGVWTMNDAGSPVSSLSIIPSPSTVPIKYLKGSAKFRGGRFR